MSNVTSFRSELKQLFHLMLPILITQFAQAGFGLIDTIMAGHLSAADLAAIAVGVGLWIPVMLLFSGIMIATTPLVAEAKGARNTEQIPVIVRQSLWVAVILGVLAMLILQLMPFFLHVFGVPESLQPKASLFLHAIGLGMPAVTMYAALRGYSEALGHPRPVTVISLLALVVLIPLNMIFMYGLGPIPALGSAGCGFATSILQWLMLITLAGYIYKASAYRNTSIFSRFDKINLTWVKRILQLGLPIGLAVFFEVSIFSTGALVLSPLGEVFIAAHQVAISVTSVLFMIPLSLAIALTIRVGTYYGEKNWASMYQVQKIGLSTAVFFALLTMSFIALGREQIVSVYSRYKCCAGCHVFALVCNGISINGCSTSQRCRLFKRYARYSGTDVDHLNGVLGNCFSNRSLFSALYRLGRSWCVVRFNYWFKYCLCFIALTTLFEYQTFKSNLIKKPMKHRLFFILCRLCPWACSNLPDKR